MRYISLIALFVLLAGLALAQPTAAQDCSLGTANLAIIKYYDLSKLAGVTGRMSLAPVILEMMNVKHGFIVSTFNNTQDCDDRLAATALTWMNATEQAFIGFMGEDEGAAMQLLLSRQYVEEIAAEYEALGVDFSTLVMLIGRDWPEE